MEGRILGEKVTAAECGGIRGEEAGRSSGRFAQARQRPCSPALPDLGTDFPGTRQLQVSRFRVSLCLTNTIKCCLSESHGLPLDLIFKYANAID